MHLKLNHQCGFVKLNRGFVELHRGFVDSR